MTSLLPRSAAPTGRPAPDSGEGTGPRRPLVLLAALGGVVAAAGPLLVCLAVGVVGWFVTDAGAHGTPRDGLRAGALAWLLAHGSGIHVSGVAITAVPLGLSLVAAWAVWRVGTRVGDAVSGHGPDADRIADGERDWTVALATLAFTVGYVVVARVTVGMAGSSSTSPSSAGVLLWSLALCVLVGGTAIAVGSGRAAIWAAFVTPTVRALVATALRVAATYLVVAGVVFLGALVLHAGSAANVLSQLHTDAGDTMLMVVLMVTVVPNAAAWSGAYLLGPGFTVGAHTVVTPGLVVLGPMPMFPMLAALPEQGVHTWTRYLVVVPALVAAYAAARTQARIPTLRWEEGAVRGVVGGALAGVLVGVLAGLSGGAVGPGRLSSVGPATPDVLVHAATVFGIGGLLGGLVMTAVQRRAARHVVAED